MKQRILALALALLLSLGTCALADGDIQVTGRATVRVEPDLAIVSLGVQERNESVTDAQANCNEKINAIVEALLAAGVERTDISTDNYSIYADYSYDYTTDTQTQNGYVASCTLAIKVRKVDEAGAIIDAAFQAGANQMGNIRFTLVDDSEARDKALELAVQDGMRKAGVIARAAGITLPRLPSELVENTDYYYYSDVYNGVMLRDAAAGETGTSVQTGMLNITASVALSYDMD